LTSIRRVPARARSHGFRWLRDGVAQILFRPQPIFNIVSVLPTALNVEFMRSTSNICLH
jgi:hypothetical protein